MKLALTALSFCVVLTLLPPGAVAIATPVADPTAPALEGESEGVVDAGADVWVSTETNPATDPDPDPETLPESTLVLPEGEPSPEGTADLIEAAAEEAFGAHPASTPPEEAGAAGSASDDQPETPGPVAGSAANRTPIANGAVATSGSDEAAILAAVNRARIANCVPVVTRNAALDRVARNWSAQMAQSGEFFHNPAFHDQIPPGSFMAGENIAAGQRTGALMFESWMASPPHRANILVPQYTDLGVGFVRGGNSIYPTHGTQAFASYSSREKGFFLDVRPWSKFYREINWMGMQKLSTGNRVPGCGARQVTYNPKNRVSREAMAAFLYRLDKSKYRGPAVSPFSDVKPGDKFYNQITWMHAKGLATGTRVPGQKPRFAPRDAVSREAMAAFIYRYERATAKAPAVSPFADMKPGDRFYKEIAWMHATRLSTGNAQPSGKPTYAPKDRVSREAMGAFIYRLKH